MSINLSRVFKHVSIIGVLFAVLFLIALGFGVQFALSNKECFRIYNKIHVELDIKDDVCNFTPADAMAAGSLKKVEDQKIQYLEKLETDYNKRFEIYSLARNNYLNLEQIGLRLNILLEHDYFKNIDPGQKNGLLLSAKIYDHNSVLLKSKIQSFKDRQLEQLDNLYQVSTVASEHGIDASGDLQNIADLTQNPLNNLQNAENFRIKSEKISSELNTLQDKLNNFPDYKNQLKVNFPILMYHRIEDYDSISPKLKSKIRRDITISPETFTKQLDFLRDKGYTTVTVSDIEDAILTKKTDFFNQKLVMLTFDDGYEEHYKIVYPELKKRGMKGVFAIVTNFRGMTWPQIREMSDGGMQIVAHTVSHCPLAAADNDVSIVSPEGGQYKSCSRLDYGGVNNMMPLNEVRFELAESKKAIETELKKEVDTVIYPYGSFNNQILEESKKLGYRLGIRVGQGPMINLSTPFSLNRVSVSGFDEDLGGWFKTI